MPVLTYNKALPVSNALFKVVFRPRKCIGDHFKKDADCYCIKYTETMLEYKKTKSECNKINGQTQLIKSFD